MSGEGQHRDSLTRPNLLLVTSGNINFKGTFRGALLNVFEGRKFGLEKNIVCEVAMSEARGNSGGQKQVGRWKSKGGEGEKWEDTPRKKGSRWTGNGLKEYRSWARDESARRRNRENQVKWAEEFNRRNFRK